MSEISRERLVHILAAFTGKRVVHANIAYEALLALEAAEAARDSARAEVERLERRVNALEAEMNPHDIAEIDAALRSAANGGSKA